MTFTFTDHTEVLLSIRFIPEVAGLGLEEVWDVFVCVSVENESHCDFVKLREMLICVNMEDLREQTHTRHYELYRRCKLEEMGFRDTDPESKPVRWELVCVCVSVLISLTNNLS